MVCELCESNEIDMVVDSPTIPWSGLGVCYDCWGQYHMGREIVTTVRKMN